MQVEHVRGLALEELSAPDRVSSATNPTALEHRKVDVQASDSIFVFTHPHLSVFVSLSPFSMSSRHL